MPLKPANKTDQSRESGTLYVVATPIGNLADITLRALETLRSVHIIAAEDTRHTRKLLSYYDIHKPLVSYHSHSQDRRGSELLRKIEEGQDIALVTDAGTPGISDPGALLIHQALEAELPVTVIPGPTALITALVASGLPTHPFAFLGFPPSRGKTRRRFFALYAFLPMTLILYESPQRLQPTLRDILASWGNRRIAVARELTKLYEETFRGTVTEAQSHFALEARGELTLVVAAADELPSMEDATDEEWDAASGESQAAETAISWQEELRSLLHDMQMTVKEAADQISRRHRLPRRMVYQEALRLKNSCFP